MAIYLLSTSKFWTPPTEDLLILQLTAVLVPQKMTEIQTFNQYLELLSDRLDWLMRETLEQENLSQEELYQQILNMLNQGEMYQLVMPEMDESTLAWAEALTTNSTELQEAMLFLRPSDWREGVTLFDFPAQPMTGNRLEAVQTLIQETSLEEWLNRMITVCRNL